MGRNRKAKWVGKMNEKIQFMSAIKKTAVVLTVLGAIIFVVNDFADLKILSERNVGNDFLKILVFISSVYVVFSEFIKSKS